MSEVAEEDRWADWPERWADGPCDVRAAMKALPREVVDGRCYEAIPWERFPHFHRTGDEVPALLAALVSGEADAAARALSGLWTALHHQGSTTETAALALPFLLRAAASAAPALRADVLTLVAVSARCQHLGDTSRGGLLHVAEDPTRIGAVDCPVDWTLQAARTVITDDRHLLLRLLADADPGVRAAAVFVLALAIGDTSEVETALHRLLAAEDDPAVQASLVLALAQLGRERGDERTVAWARALWSDPGRQRHVRVAAGIAWLCLVDDAVPDGLRAFLTHPDTARQGCLFQRVPWFPPVDPTSGLRLCVHDMLAPHAAWDPSPWPD